MYQTHSRNDFACIKCGTEVWFNVAYPTGKWKEADAKKLEWISIRTEKAQRGLGKIAEESGVVRTELCEYQARIVAWCDSAETAKRIKGLWPTGFAGIIPVDTKIVEP